MSTVEGLNIV